MTQDRARLSENMLPRWLCARGRTRIGTVVRSTIGITIGNGLAWLWLDGGVDSHTAMAWRPAGPPVAVRRVVPDSGGVQDTAGSQGAGGSQGSGDVGSDRVPPVSDAADWAFVQGLAIGDGEVRFLLRQLEPATTGQRALLDGWLATANSEASGQRPALPSPVIRAAVEQWIERMVVLAFLERQALASSPERVASELELLDKQLREQGSSLAAYCDKSGIRRAALERHLRWELSWNRYLSQRVTDAALQAFYDRYPAEFDGRRRRLAHIVLVWEDESSDAEDGVSEGDDRRVPTPWPRPPRAGTSERVQAMEHIRRQIVAGELTFAEAAARHSQGASAGDGGDLGWTLRTGPLSEVVSQAAFRLKMGEISLPIVSPHGVHLLTILAEEPGQRSFEQVKEQVKQTAIRELWQAILRQETPRLSIEYRPPRLSRGSND